MKTKMLSLLVAMIAGGCATAPQMTVVHSFSGDAGNSAVFFDAPCTKASVLQHVRTEFHPAMKAAEGLYDGKAYDLCWTDDPNGSGGVILVWEDGGMGMLGKEILKPGTGV